MRCLVSWLGASCVGFVAASLCHSQQVQAQLINLGAHIDFSTRLAAMADDLVGLSPTYLPIIAVGFAIAFFIATFTRTKTSWPPALLFSLAGAAALGCILALMQPIMEITLMAGARGWLGLGLEIAAGALGGLTYAYLVQPRPSNE